MLNIRKNIFSILFLTVMIFSQHSYSRASFAELAEDVAELQKLTKEIVGKTFQGTFTYLGVVVDRGVEKVKPTTPCFVEIKTKTIPADDFSDVPGGGAGYERGQREQLSVIVRDENGAHVNIAKDGGSDMRRNPKFHFYRVGDNPAESFVDFVENNRFQIHYDRKRWFRKNTHVDVTLTKDHKNLKKVKAEDYFGTVAICEF